MLAAKTAWQQFTLPTRAARTAFFTVLSAHNIDPATALQVQ
jgi:hypothetical protein